MHNLTPSELDDLLEAAAERGAKAALSQVGLNDPDSLKDIVALRDLLGTYRKIKDTVVSTFVNWLVLTIIGAAATGAYLFLKDKH